MEPRQDLPKDGSDLYNYILDHANQTNMEITSLYLQGAINSENARTLGLNYTLSRLDYLRMCQDEMIESCYGSTPYIPPSFKEIIILCNTLGLNVEQLIDTKDIYPLVEEKDINWKALQGYLLEKSQEPTSLGVEGAEEFAARYENALGKRYIHIEPDPLEDRRNFSKAIEQIAIYIFPASAQRDNS